MICNVFIKEENSHSQKTPRAAASRKTTPRDNLYMMCSAVDFFQLRRADSCGFRSLYINWSNLLPNFLFTVCWPHHAEWFRCSVDETVKIYRIWMTKRTPYLHIFGLSATDGLHAPHAYNIRQYSFKILLVKTAFYWFWFWKHPNFHAWMAVDT